MLALSKPLRSNLLLAVLCLSAILSTGCRSLLPTSQTLTIGTWKSFEEAEAALKRIEPGKTTRTELAAAGFDPYKTPNIVMLTYSDILLRFPVTGAMPLEQLDPGLRACFSAGKACDGYQIQLKDVHRNRVGNFWLDWLGFDRPVDVTGWNFNAIVIIVEEVVVFTLHGGQPMIHEYEKAKSPLGPFQGSGNSIPGILK